MTTAKLRVIQGGARTVASARLRRAICAAGLTQHEAGALIGKDARQVRRWLSGRVALGALELVAAIESLGDQQAPVAQLDAAPVPNPEDASSILVGGLPQETTKRRAA